MPDISLLLQQHLKLLVMPELEQLWEQQVTLKNQLRTITCQLVGFMRDRGGGQCGGGCEES